MDKLVQLVEQSKKTVLNLQQQSEQWSALLSADQVLCDLASSSISSLLRPFSMNRITCLNQAVSVAQFVSDSSPQEHRPLSMPAFPATPFDLSAAKKVPVQNRGATPTPIVLLPSAKNGTIGEMNSTEKHRTVTKILNRFAQAKQDKMGVDEKSAKETDRQQKTVDWKIPPSSAPDRKGVIAKPVTDATAATVSTTTPAGNGPKNWFKMHRNYTTAASIHIPVEEGYVDKKMLTNWLKPISKMQKKSGSAHEPKTNTPAPSSSHSIDHSTELPRGWATSPGSSPRRPAHQKQDKHLASPETIDHEQMSTEQQQPAHATQLEKLVQSWQKTKKPVKEPVPESAAVQPQRTDNLLKLAISSPSVHPTEKSDNLVQQNQETDNDHIFTDTLERVLHREMRRHGLGGKKI